nr:unnamed protein product [Digitaria exilis]
MENPPRLLPYDVLADVLSRLAPRSLAVSRCVCREWRAIVDERCQLHPDLLPISLGGIFILTHEPEPPDFFARPSMARRIGGKLENYVDRDQYNIDDYPDIVDCCNGLLLLDRHVVNPATRQWVRLLPCPVLSEGNTGFGSYQSSYLVFDPTLSPHYECRS